jgi:predicted SnoaL-like aldol condensation-catalyzing enzyme
MRIPASVHPTAPARVNGKKVSIIYSNIYRVVDGKIRENWANADRLSLAEQFGMQLSSAGASK